MSNDTGKADTNAANTGEMSLDELDNVAGGVSHTDIKLPKTPGDLTKEQYDKMMEKIKGQ